MTTGHAIPLPTPEPASDEELVLRARSGDRWAEEALYRKHIHQVSAVVARLLRHGPDVEDVVQDTFACAFVELGSLRQPARFRAWLMTSAVHRVHKVFRRRRLRRLLGLESGYHDAPLSAQAVSAASQEARAELTLLDRALDQMKDTDRVCWVLRHLVGHSVRDVASLAGCSVATAKRRLARAQAQVADHFATSRGADGNTSQTIKVREVPRDRP